MTVGLIKWFETTKGFGVVSTPTGEEYFLHRNNFRGNISLAQIGHPVSFKESTARNKKLAEKCSYANGYKDLCLALNFLGKDDFIRTESDRINLIPTFLKFYLEHDGKEILFDLLREYYTKNLDFSLFINFSEKIEVSLPNESANELFTFFGENLNEKVLFLTWKNRKFQFIGKEQEDEYDYEIPENVLDIFFDKLELQDFKRIGNYEISTDFKNRIIEKLIVGIDIVNDELNVDNSYLIKVEETIKILAGEKNDEAKKIFYRKIIELNKEIINGKIKNFGEINSIDTFQDYRELIDDFPEFLSSEIIHDLTNFVNDLIIKNCNKDFLFDLWLEEFPINISDQKIQFEFSKKEISIKRKSEILCRTEKALRNELLKSYFKSERPIKGYELLNYFLRSKEFLGHNFSWKDELFLTDFWEKESADIIEEMRLYSEEIIDKDEQFILYFEGLSQKIPKTLILKRIGDLKLRDITFLTKNKSCEEEYLLNVYSLFLKYINQSQDFKELYSLAENNLSKKLFSAFDASIYEKVNDKIYLELWENGKAKKLPINALKNYLNNIKEDYEKLNTWLKRFLISSEDLKNIIFENLLSKNIDNRIDLYRYYYQVKCLLDLDLCKTTDLLEHKNDDFDIILWLIGKIESLNFNLLSHVFAYLEPSDQVTTLKRIFSSVNKKKLFIEIEGLQKLITVNEKTKKRNIDISVIIVLRALLSYKQKGIFLLDGEVLNIIINNVSESQKRFKIEKFFEKCEGRSVPKFSFHDKKGIISKVPFGNGKFYFCIDFDYDASIVEQVRMLPGRKYDKNNKNWGVPSKYEEQVLNFAAKYRFELNFEGNKFQNNKHLANFKRGEVPNGVSFCDAPLSKKLDNTFQESFWWCAGKPCHHNCQTLHKEEEWAKYTLYDFVNILGLNVDSTGKLGNVIKDGDYHRFLTLLNRINRLLERLYCDECNNVLHPYNESDFAAYRVVKFCCKAEKCSKAKVPENVVYLNHCLNGKCNTIIDSRISKTCPHGLFICGNCGSCCSHSFYERRIHVYESNYTKKVLQTHTYYKDAKKKFENKAGHLDRAIYYCHLDGNLMTETTDDVFSCSCGNKYDTKEYKLKRPHRHVEI